MSGHGAQPRSNQGWFLWREENRRTRRKTLEAQERINKLNSHMMPGPEIEPGTIVVRGERSHLHHPCSHNLNKNKWFSFSHSKLSCLSTKGSICQHRLARVLFKHMMHPSFEISGKKSLRRKEQPVTWLTSNYTIPDAKPTWKYNISIVRTLHLLYYLFFITILLFTNSCAHLLQCFSSSEYWKRPFVWASSRGLPSKWSRR